MATPEEQITPADAAIVTTGTGRKGPEEHDLPESLKYDMDLCLEILRNVLGEYNPELLSTFDTVRHYAVEASAEHFAELKDPNPDQDGLKEAVNVIDNMTLHDAQLLARAFATYFHLANLSEENYRVSVLHERENNVPVDQAVDPINELTVAYHQLINETGPAKAKELLNQLEFHPVFTAHPTEARRKAVEGKIRRVSELLEEYKRLGGSDKKECLRRLYNEIDALFRTSPIALKKPTPVEEADTILDIFDNTLFNTIPKVYRRFDDWVLGDKAGLVEPACPAFFHPGSWIGSDRDGNPNVTAKVSRAVARKFSDHVIAALEQATRTVGRNLTMEAETTPPSAELKNLWSHQKEMSERLTDKAALISTKEMHRAVMLVMADRLHYTIERDADLMYHSCEDYIADLKTVQRSLAEANAKRSAYGPLQDLIWQAETFGFHMVEMEFRQHSVVHARALADIREHGLHGERGELQPMTHEVLDTFRVKAAVTGLQCHVAEGHVAVGDKFDLAVDEARREATARNHSVTHLMHFALRTVLGDKVAQKGSLVTPESTRFDFSYGKPVTAEQIAEVERIVNAQILKNTPVQTRVLPIEEAKKTGAVMLFGERYGEVVRMLDIGKSTEFCGGTHVKATGDIGFFKVVSESGIAAGVRRIEAVTGMNALSWVQNTESLLAATAREFKAPVSEVPVKAADAIATIRTLEKGIDQLKSQMAAKAGDALISEARDVKGVKVLLARLDGADAKALRETMDKVKDKLGSAVAVLASVTGEDRVQLAAGVTKDLTGRVKAGELAGFVAGLLGGKGGGKPDLAMAGGSDVKKLPEALEAARAWIEGKL